MPWRREQPPTLVFWPGEVHGIAKSMDRIVHGVAMIHEKTIIQKDTCTSMFTAALFSIARA